MKLVFATLLVLLAPVVGARDVQDVEGSKQYPVTKVVTLLKDMQTQLSKEAEEDEEVYDKMACWCKTNDKEKTESIKAAETRIADLTTTIESSAAQSARLKTEIANHESDLAKSQQSLNQLAAIRTKQATQFNGEEKDMLQSIQALKSAIVVLQKHQGKTSLVDDTAMNQVAQVVKTEMDKHKMMLLGIVTPHQKRIVGSFLQQGNLRNSQPAKPVDVSGGQSGEIFGVLKQMLDTFQSNLSQSQAEELANKKSFEEQKSAKNDEIKAIANSMNEKKTQLSKADELNAQSKEDLEDTKNSLSIDDKFLMDLKERCRVNDQEWQQRQKDRQDELSAIAQAITILSADAARDNFSKTFNPKASFVQARSITRHSDARLEAARMLKKVADKVGSPELAALSMSAQLDAFVKVKEAIDKMVKQLGTEKAAEIKQKDFCTSKMAENTLLVEKETRKKTDSEMKIATLESTVTERTSQIATLNGEIAEMNIQVKKAGESRELANRDFQATIADQKETQKLLTKAITVLKAVYKTAPAASLASVKASIGQPKAPAGFKGYKQNAGGGGAIALLTQILGDAKVMEAEAVKDEQAAQTTYEKFVTDTNTAISSKQTAIVNKQQDKASAEQDLRYTKTDLEAQVAQLTSLGNQGNDLKLQCDFLLKNFDVRQTARDEEVEALKQARAILSGMQTE